MGRIQHPKKNLSGIPDLDSGSQKAPDPESGSAALVISEIPLAAVSTLYVLVSF